MNTRHSFPETTFSPGLADSWRVASQDMAEHLRFLRQYWQTIAEKDDRLSSGHLVHKPASVAMAVKLLPWRLSLYIECLKIVSLAEQRMDASGMAYAKSSDAWEN